MLFQYGKNILPLDGKISHESWQSSSSNVKIYSENSISNCLFCDFLSDILKKSPFIKIWWVGIWKDPYLIFYFFLSLKTGKCCYFIERLSLGIPLLLHPSNQIRPWGHHRSRVHVIVNKQENIAFRRDKNRLAKILYDKKKRVPDSKFCNLVEENQIEEDGLPWETRALIKDVLFFKEWIEHIT